MRSNQSFEIGDGPRAARRISLRTLLLLAITFAISPPAFELAELCVADWRAMFGAVPVVETPALDLIGELWADAARLACRAIGWLVSPDVIMGTLFGCAGVGFLLMQARGNRS